MIAPKAHDGGMTNSTHTHSGSSTHSRLERPRSGRVVAGVASGIAEYTQVSTGLVRLAFVIASVFGGFGLLAYIVAWLLMPAEGKQEPVGKGWIEDLRTPGRTTGALLIGVLAVLAVAAAIPGGAALALALLTIGVLVSGPRRSSQIN